jgi:hypothetical protein
MSTAQPTDTQRFCLSLKKQKADQAIAEARSFQRIGTAAISHLRPGNANSPLTLESSSGSSAGPRDMQ